MVSEPHDADLVLPPDAVAMVESLRAFGYSLPAAVADLIDNSITASARRIDVDFRWAGGASTVSVLDDGSGMDADELTSAMRLGSRSPREARDPGDLGRFGLGLKTASFSQARSLTVASRRAGGQIAVRRWDLDEIARTRDWTLLTSPADAARPAISALERRSHGTAVVWDKADRLVGRAELGDRAAQRRFHELLGQTEHHLAMTFHTFLTGRRAVQLVLNDGDVQPWDPFLTGHPATQTLPTEALVMGGRRVASVHPYVLPHQTRLTPGDHSHAAGPRGWNAQQGFYVYRARRLLVSGDWLGLFQKEEHHKLARIRVDLPNSTDETWQIDVRKATARPPGHLRDDLRRIATRTRAQASQVYRHRGKQLARSAQGEESFVWAQQIRQELVSYRVNRAHPLVRQVVERHGSDVETLLRLVEETVPAELIAMDATERPDQRALPFQSASQRQLKDLLDSAYDALRATGADHDGACRALAVMEPFDRYPELVAARREREEAA